MSFTKHFFFTKNDRSLFNSEIESLIQRFADLNNLLLPYSFCRHDYEFISYADPTKREIDYKITFIARPKTPDDILCEQLEYQIKNLES